MTKYKLKAQDEKIIEFISKKILPIANEVTNFYSHWTTSDEEGDLQKAFLYECRQEGISLTREVAITQYYKDLAFRDLEQRLPKVIKNIDKRKIKIFIKNFKSYTKCYIPNKYSGQVIIIDAKLK